MKIYKAVIVPYSAAEMFAIAEDITRYPHFLPWCASVEILAHSGSAENGDYRRTARIYIQKFGIKTAFTTENWCHPPVENDDAFIAITSAPQHELEYAPFHDIHGQWRFSNLGSKDSGLGSKITVEMTYVFKNKVLEKLLGQFFASAIEGFAQAFVARAHDLHISLKR